MLFHPRFEDSRANRILSEARSDFEHITFHDLYEAYPDFNIDIPFEKHLVEAHDLLIWQHPFYWYSCPPMLKQWLDLVLEYGWAYGRNGNSLKGKSVLQVVTVGGSTEVYQHSGRNRFTVRELLRPFDQTAYLCQMHYLPPFVVFGSNRLNQDELSEYGLLLKQWVERISDPNSDLNLLNGEYLQDTQNLVHG